MTVEQICRKVIAQAGLPPDALRFTLCVEHALREYCVQYRESDWDFIRRILAEDGCNFYFEHMDPAHTMVVSNNTTVQNGVARRPSPTSGHRNSGMIADTDHIIDLCYEETIGPGRFSARDYNYLEPSDTLDSQFGGEAQDLEDLRLSGAANPGAGRAITQARLGALQVRFAAPGAGAAVQDYAWLRDRRATRPLRGRDVRGAASDTQGDAHG